MAKQRLAFTDQIRQALADCGVTRYRLWKRTGISQATLSLFVRGETGISEANLDRLAEELGLEIVVREKGAGKPKTRVKR